MNVTKGQLVEKLDHLEKAYKEWTELGDNIRELFGWDFIDGKLFSNLKDYEFIWDDENPYIFKDFSERCWYMPGKMRANVYAQVIDPEDVWQMVAEEIGECL